MSQDVSDSVYPPLETIEPPNIYDYSAIRYDTPFRTGNEPPNDTEDEGSLAGEPYFVPSTDVNGDGDFDRSRHAVDVEYELDVDAEISDYEVTTKRRASRGRPRGKGRGRGRGRGRGGGSLRGSRGLRGRARKSDVERGPGRPRGSGRDRGTAKQIKKAKLPQPEDNAHFQELVARATDAYLVRRLEEALDLARQAVQLNPEIFSAHSLLSRIHQDLGQPDQALTILWSGAHTQNDADVWMDVATRTQEISLGEHSAVQEQVMYCYNKIVRLNDRHFDARHGRMHYYISKNSTKRAMKEAQACCTMRPLTLEVLQIFAHLSLDCKEPLAAKRAYDIAAEHYWEQMDDEEESEFSFSDVHIYGELFDALKLWDEGLFKIKRLSRAICGRKAEALWDNVSETDCEWDFDDYPRRNTIFNYEAGVYDIGLYGHSLPPEVRAQMGLFRLKLGTDHAEEAFHHLALFEPEDDSPLAPVHEVPDIFQVVADTLRKEDYAEEALRFYDALLRTRTYNINSRPKMAELYRIMGRTDEALELFQDIARDETNNYEARIAIAKIYESLAQRDLALSWASKVVKMGYIEAVQRAKFSFKIPGLEEPIRGMVMPGIRGKRNNASRVWNPKRRLGGIDASTLKLCWDRAKALTTDMRAGDSKAMAEWINCVELLTDFFRDQPIFHPAIVSTPFFGYSHAARKRAKMVDWDQPVTEIEQLAGLLRNALGNEAMPNADASADADPSLEAVPTDFGGIAFTQWLEWFCELGFNYARQGDAASAYDILAAATRANVFYFSDDRILYIHTVEIVCALMLNDVARLCDTSRWFMRQYPWATDTYRLYQALHRVQIGESVWYASGPNQKFIRRAIRSHDYAIMDDDSRARHGFTEFETNHFLRTTAKDSNELPERLGNPHDLSTLDPQLLVMYGNVLHAASSFQNALAYYLRVYAMDPGNALNLLSISTAYAQNAFKRQTDNRHYHIMQGIAFFEKYRDARLGDLGQFRGKKKRWLQSHREAEIHFNEGRMYHLLGLPQLASPAYERCLAIGDQGFDEHDGDADGDWGMVDEQEKQDDGCELGVRTHFQMEAALALQNLLASGGDMVAARRVTEKYLVF
ncbi:MAG: transcription factor TFIIIC subunit tfc4 [Chrysothrix sp. TS-e1954]|nr:MAG: transcription factor TFIIIC subunit tfc4 [Chrysothrix sp. TS-e1954]